MPVSKIQLGQLWRADETGDTWLVTKAYSEVFSSYVVLRKVGDGGNELRRVKIAKTARGMTLPGYTFLQASQNF